MTWARVRAGVVRVGEGGGRGRTAGQSLFPGAVHWPFTPPNVSSTPTTARRAMSAPTPAPENARLAALERGARE